MHAEVNRANPMTVVWVRLCGQLQRPGTEGQLQDEADLDETLEEENVAEAQVENFEVLCVWVCGCHCVCILL